jgi:hypothetical protein
MPSQVISFRMSEEAIALIRERAKAGESDSQAAQRLLNNLLGTSKEIELTEVDSRIQEAIAPIRQELEALKAELGKSAA